MISEYILFGTIILALFLLFTIFLIRPIVKGLAAKEKLSTGDNRSVLNKIQLNIRIILFFLIFILLGKALYLIAFPLEISHYNYTISAISDAVILFFVQIAALILYGSIFSLVLLYDKLKPNYRYYFLDKVLRTTILFSVGEMIITSFLFALQQYRFIWSVTYPGGLLNKMLPWTSPGEYTVFYILLEIAIFIIYSALFYWNIRRYNRLLQEIIAALGLLGALFYSILILPNWHFLFSPSMTTEKIFSLFLPSGGMSATVWFALFVITVVSQILTFFICLLQDKFMAVQLNTHYRLQLNRISYYGLSGLLLLLLWPAILVFFFQ